MKQSISIFGTGYVGLVTGVCLAEKNNHVIGVDVDVLKIEKLKKGICPIFEPGLESLLKANYAKNNLEFTVNAQYAVEKADIIFIAVGTPPNEDGSADLQYVLQVAQTVATYMNSPKTIVTKSTVPVGTFQKVKQAVQKILDARNVDIEFDLVSNPEFLREGCAVEDCMSPDRAIIGVETERAGKTMRLLLEPFLQGRPLHVMNPASSEMTKYAANSILAAKISIMNEFSRLCEKVGADVESVREGLSSDHRIGPHFIYAGVGYGGSCFPKDVKALIQTGDENFENMEILKAVEAANQLQRELFFQKVSAHFNHKLAGRKITIWGVAFKPGTDDIREAPAIYLMEKLADAGAFLTIYDPVAEANTLKHFGDDIRIEFEQDPYEALDNADALCLITEWQAFRDPDFAQMKAKMSTPVIFDGRNCYSVEMMQSLGFNYHSIGREATKVSDRSAEARPEISSKKYDHSNALNL